MGGWKTIHEISFMNKNQIRSSELKKKNQFSFETDFVLVLSEQKPLLIFNLVSTIEKNSSSTLYHCPKKSIYSFTRDLFMSTRVEWIHFQSLYLLIGINITYKITSLWCQQELIRKRYQKQKTKNRKDTTLWIFLLQIFTFLSVIFIWHVLTSFEWCWYIG